MDGYWKPWAEDNYLISTSEKQAQLLAQITEGKKSKVWDHRACIYK